MTKIIPFNAVVYNQSQVKDLSRVVCPPYDVISATKQVFYHQKDQHNLIHILLGLDTPGEDKYERSGTYFQDWFKEKVLIKEENPAIYFYSQDYLVKGERRTRLGFIALLRLEDKGGIYRHEHTRIEAKEDRFKLINQVKANLSPIFVIFQDKKRIIQRIYQKDLKGKQPFIDIEDDDKTIHKLWRIDFPEAIKNIQDATALEDMFIADGHHRYEVACAYRDQIRKISGQHDPEAGINYVMTYFTNTDPRGLLIMPIHRLIKLASGFNLNAFLDSVKEYFDIEEIKDKTRFFFLMAKGGRTEHLFGMYKDKKYWLLRLKNIKILDKLMMDKPKEYRKLDVSILNAIILQKILKIDTVDKNSLTYNNDADELIKKVDEDNSYLAFFLNPVKVEEMISVAVTGERMPAKSTFFYPKVISGLVINKLD